MLFSFQDRFTQEFFISKIGEDAGPDADFAHIERQKEHATKKLELVLRYARAHQCDEARDRYAAWIERIGASTAARSGSQFSSGGGAYRRWHCRDERPAVAASESP